MQRSGGNSRYTVDLRMFNPNCTQLAKGFPKRHARKLIITAIFALAFGFLAGNSFREPVFENGISYVNSKSADPVLRKQQVLYLTQRLKERSRKNNTYSHYSTANPVDLPTNKYLVTFTVGVNQKKTIDAAVKKFSENFTIMLFHYDDRASEWDEFEWSRRAIHVSVKKQTKWWFSKRFLHPEIVARFDYLFIWDEDLGVENFDAEEYIKVVKKHGLEISQPALESRIDLTWQMTKRRNNTEVHKYTNEKNGHCTDPHLPPCAAFVEIMATVFSRDAWRCVWNLVQNDLVHGWGLDFALRRCVESAHEKIGVVDSQWIAHLGIPSLGDQGKTIGRTWKVVNDRCFTEWSIFLARMSIAEALDLEESKSNQTYLNILHDSIDRSPSMASSSLFSLPPTSSLDAAHIRRAAEIADMSAGMTSPHPNFGCVVARGKDVVGEGYLYAQGTKCAELQAVEMAGERARGATAYLNLEPGDCYGDLTPVSSLIQESKELLLG